MKKIFFLLLLIITSTAYAQTKPRPCMPSEGYWVVESNVKTPKESTVHFYTQDQVLVYSQQFSGKKINVKRKKTVQQLNSLLMQSLVAYKQHSQTDRPALVKN